MKIPGSYVEARAWRLARAGPRVRRLARLRPMNRNQRMKRNALMRMEVRENNAAKSKDLNAVLTGVRTTHGTGSITGNIRARCQIVSAEPSPA